jgi:hypothetical protein
MFKFIVTVFVVLWGTAFAAERNAYFGDLHVHTRYSFDAYIFNVRTDPNDAYRYAKGEPLQHAFGYPIRLRGAPLDFMAVTDHATYMGVLHAMGDANHPLAKTDLAKQLISSDPAIFLPAFRQVAQSIITGEADPRLEHTDVKRDTWQKEIEAAERHNEPGVFTTFIGYEYTSMPPYNLHRNVIFRGTQAPDMPFAATDSLNPEDLWRWMDELRDKGMESLAIPHNSNWSNGLMFQRTTFAGDPLDAAYAEVRMRNEPIVEMTQVKGTSDTHPLLSPNDEWADFEIFADEPEIFSTFDAENHAISLEGSYVRDALKTGLQFEANENFNPYRFGLIGASDTHNAGAPYEEQSYYSKTGINDGLPVRRGSVLPEGVASWEAFDDLPADKKPPGYLADWSASGLAGVWAEQNTRESLYDAMRRKEVFATSGTRIRVRFFAGPGLTATSDSATLYARGVPMGGDLNRSGKSPTFIAHALRDPQSAWLQRLQIVKGWIEDGNTKEAVFDIACSDGASPDRKTHRCPDNGATVDLNTCNFSFEKGDVELRAAWQDPTFDPDERAFYYVRVLENPTCRWTTWDALRAGIEPRPGIAPTIQERAWSSPIWYVP